MKKGFKAVTAAALAISALTPVAAFAAENTVENGVYTTTNFYSLDAFKKLSGSAKAAALTSEGAVIVVAGKVYTGANVLSLNDTQLDASAVTVDAYNAANDNKLVSGKPIGGGDQTADFKVSSVSAINPTTVEINFNTAVVASDAEGATPSNTTNLSKFSIGSNNPTDVKLSEDGKKATLTFAASVEGENLAVVVEPITTKANDNVKTERYANTLTYKDTVKPTVTKVESVTGGDQATTATLTFSEPVASVGAIKLNGVALVSGTNYTLNAGDTELTLTGLNLDSSKEHTLELVTLEDQATKANVTDYIKQTFKPVVDKVTPVVTAVEAKSDTALVFTFSKKVAIDTTANASTYINLFDANLADQTALLGTEKFSEVAGSNGTKWEVTIGNPFTGSAKSADLTVKVLDKVISDPQGNKIAQVLKNVKVSKDEVAPKITDAKYRTAADGKVKELVFTFDEDVTLTTSAALTDLLSDKSVNVENSVSGDLADALGGSLPAGTFTVKDNTITFTLTTPIALSGKYSLEVAAGKVADKSLSTNANKAHAFTLDFGAAKQEETFKVNTASATSNVITVAFDEAVKGGTGAGSATLLSAYKLNGQALPAGTTITLDSTQENATITLPEGTIKDTDTAAIFIADNIVSKDGKKNLVKFTGTVGITDNVAPELTGVTLTADNNLLVTFSEAVTVDVADFEISINGTATDATLTATPGTGSDVGKYVINLSSLIKDEATDTVLEVLADKSKNIVLVAGATGAKVDLAKSSAVESITVKVIGQATKDDANNTIKTDTEIKVK